MSADTPAAFTRSWQVGSRTVTLTVPTLKPGQQLTAISEWTPDMPDRMTEAEVAAYISGRNAALAEMTQELGIRVAVVDLGSRQR